MEINTIYKDWFLFYYLQFGGSGNDLSLVEYEQGRAFLPEKRGMRKK